jgi:hypothetical protein
MEKEVVIWGDLRGVEARGVTDEVDLGEVQQIGKNYVLTEKGTIGKEHFFVPKYLVEGYDGHTLWFRVTEGQKVGFRRESEPTYEEYLVYKTEEVPVDVETHVHIIDEERKEKRL